MNENTLSSNLTRIKDAVDDIRTATNLTSSDSIEDVADAVEALAGGSSGVYKVSSVAEMNEIQNPSSGDLCVVYNQQNPSLRDRNDFSSVWVFPDTVTFDESIESQFEDGTEGNIVVNDGSGIAASLGIFNSLIIDNQQVIILKIYNQNYHTSQSDDDIIEIARYTSSDYTHFTRDSQIIPDPFEFEYNDQSLPFAGLKVIFTGSEIRFSTPASFEETSDFEQPEYLKKVFREYSSSPVVTHSRGNLITIKTNVSLDTPVTSDDFTPDSITLKNSDGLILKTLNSNIYSNCFVLGEPQANTGLNFYLRWFDLTSAGDTFAFDMVNIRDSFNNKTMSGSANFYEDYDKITILLPYTVEISLDNNSIGRFIEFANVDASQTYKYNGTTWVSVYD